MIGRSKRARLESWSHSEEATLAWGEALGRALDPPAWIGLKGPLGAGKTRFVQGLARGLEIRGRVRSPTFVLENRYEGRVPLRHLDLFRLEAPGPELEASWEDDDRAIVAVEWAERVLDPPLRSLQLTLEPQGETLRRVILEWDLASGVLRHLDLRALFLASRGRVHSMPEEVSPPMPFDSASTVPGAGPGEPGPAQMLAPESTRMLVLERPQMLAPEPPRMLAPVPPR